MHKRFLTLLILPLLCAQKGVNAQQCSLIGPRGYTIVVKALKKNKVYTGFDVYADNQLAVPVRFSSLGMLTASTVKLQHMPGEDILTFSPLQGAPNSGITPF